MPSLRLQKSDKELTYLFIVYLTMQPIIQFFALECNKNVKAHAQKSASTFG